MMISSNIQLANILSNKYRIQCYHMMQIVIYHPIQRIEWHTSRENKTILCWIVSYGAIADELASAAGLIMGQSNEKKPVILIKGFNKESYSNFDAADLVVNEKNDLYR